MPEWIMNLLRSKNLTDEQIADITQSVVNTANQCSEDSKSLEPAEEDRLRRYNM